MASRKERLQELAEHARKVINDHPEFDRQAIYQALDEHIIIEYGLSQSARKDYVVSIAAILKKELTRRDSEIEAKIPKLDHNVGVLYGKPAGVVPKERLFMEVFARLTGAENNEVSETLLIDELLKTGKFVNESEARDYMRKVNRDGKTYERRNGYWVKA
jgi:hypothetical protein